MKELKSYAALASKLITSFLLFIIILSCKGHETGKLAKDKLEENAVSEDQNYHALMQIQAEEGSAKHASFNGLISEFVWQMFQDSEGRFWFCTNHDGVIIYDGDSVVQFTSNDGLGGSAVRDILEDQNGTIWLGTSKGLTEYKNGKFINHLLPNGESKNEIWSIKQDAKGLIWLGTVDGVSIFDGTNFRDFKVEKAELEKAESMISENRISDILIAKSGAIWFVTDGYGISKFNGGSFDFLTVENGLTDNSVADVFEDSKGNIWIGTFYGGVSKYDGQDFINFTQDDLIEGIETYNFYEDTKGYVWFSAENHGVYRYNGTQFEQFTMEDGLSTNTIQSIFEDHKGQIWFSTWDGLSLYDGHSIMNASDKEPWTSNQKAKKHNNGYSN